MSVRIVDVREVTKPIASPIRNAYIDFSKMTTSLVAVVTNVVRNGRRVVGYGFNSNGRYGQGGLIRERFAPRLLEADPASCSMRAGDNLDPDRVWAAMMANEKPGGHGERSVAVGTLDMAVWDAVAKIAGKPLFRLLAERHGRRGEPAGVRLCRRRLLLPGQGLDGIARRDARLSRARLQRRQDEDRRRVARRRPTADRGGAGGDRQRRTSSRSMPTVASIWRRRSPTRRCCAIIRCSGTRKAGDPLDYHSAGRAAPRRGAGRVLDSFEPERLNCLAVPGGSIDQSCDGRPFAALATSQFAAIGGVVRMRWISAIGTAFT